MSCSQFPSKFPLNFFRIWDLRSAVLGFKIGAFSTSAFYQGLVSNLVLCRFTMPRICCTIEHMRTGKTHESHIQNCNSGHFERPGAQASSFLCNCWLSLTCFACNSSYWGWFPVMVRGLGDGNNGIGFTGLPHGGGCGVQALSSDSLGGHLMSPLRDSP